MCDMCKWCNKAQPVMHVHGGSSQPVGKEALVPYTYAPNAKQPRNPLCCSSKANDRCSSGECQNERSYTCTHTQAAAVLTLSKGLTQPPSKRCAKQQIITTHLATSSRTPLPSLKHATAAATSTDLFQECRTLTMQVGTSHRNPRCWRQEPPCRGQKRMQWLRCRR
jgi:hypothetical protein